MGQHFKIILAIWSHWSPWWSRTCHVCDCLPGSKSEALRSTPLSISTKPQSASPPGTNITKRFLPLRSMARFLQFKWINTCWALNFKEMSSKSIRQLSLSNLTFSCQTEWFKFKLAKRNFTSWISCPRIANLIILRRLLILGKGYSYAHFKSLFNDHANVLNLSSCS